MILTLYPTPADSTIALALTGVANGAVTITRTDVNGTRPVRQQSGKVAAGGVFVVVDYEPAQLGLVRYDVVDTANVRTTASTSLAPGTYTRARAIGRNLIPGGAFESALNVWAGGTVVVEGAGHTYRVVPHTSPFLGTESICNVRADVAPATAYRLTFAAVAETAGGPVSIEAIYYTAAGAMIGGLTVLASKTLTTGWTTHTLTFTTPATAAAVALYWRGAGMTYRLDQVTLNAVADTAPAGYWDGDTPPAAGAVYIWDGTPGISSSTALVADPYTITETPVPTLHVVTLPALRAVLPCVLDYGADQDTMSVLHDIVRRPDPIANLGPIRTREGRLEIWCPDHAQAATVAAIAGAGEICQFRQPDHTGLDMYLLVRRVTTRPRARTIEGWRWIVALDYRAVTAPTGPILGAAGWTVAAVAATYPTVAAVTATYPTVADLTIGPR